VFGAEGFKGVRAGGQRFSRIGKELGKALTSEKRMSPAQR
jgi:hypothetical protein